MSGSRPNPFTLVFGQLAAERFPPVRSGLQAPGRDPRDRDSFLLLREVAELMRELRPDEGIGTAMEALVALVHHAYLFWADGQRIRTVSDAELAGMLEGRPASRYVGRTPAAEPNPPADQPGDSPACYVQLPALRVWGTPLANQPVEPLDGWFLSRSKDHLSALAIFGLSPGRAGLTAVEVAGARPGALMRPDGSALFAPTLPGGVQAGLASLSGEAELLELVWRAEAAA